tara:strand:+ start:984 stop:1160 length:177 start_codon:yes stop_codon:yes gene_type:complete
MSYSTEESQWMFVTGTIRKLKTLNHWIMMGEDEKKFIESSIKELEKAQEILRKKVDKQ